MAIAERGEAITYLNGAICDAWWMKVRGGNRLMMGVEWFMYIGRNLE